ncbi:MAG: SH3 domain-containing protein [Desulfuromonadales bacterium]
MRFALSLLFILVLTGTAAAKMVSVSSYVANIHSSPAVNDYNVTLQVPRYYPLSVEGTEGRFYQVVDYQGRRGWVHESVVSSTPAVIVKVNQANVRSGPGTNNSLKFRAKLGVTFQVLEKKGDWLHVKHESGNTGWLFGNLAWGAK